MIHGITSEDIESIIKTLIEVKNQLAEHTDMNEKLNNLIIALSIELQKDQND